MDNPVEKSITNVDRTVVSGQQEVSDAPDPVKRSDSDKERSYTLGDFFTIKRGVETGGNDFFILTPMEVFGYDLPEEFLRPILPGPSALAEQEIVADSRGDPILDNKRFLLNSPLQEWEIKQDYPSLWRYLEMGMERCVHERYSCRHRNPWYSQERRPPAPYLCAYMGKSNKGDDAPFRFILNHSKAIAQNVYLMMYPRPALARRLRDDYSLRVTLWGTLNDMGNDEVLHRSRIYGDASGKLEPMELASVPADRIVALMPDLVPDSVAQMNLFGQQQDQEI